MDPIDKEPNTRRRGKALEDAILDAGWEQLVSAGYGAFTIDAVAERAATSKPVIYRRWPSREALAVATVKHTFYREPLPIPDTGALRTDLIAMLSQANDSRLGMAAMISVQLATFYQETGTTPAVLRAELLGERISPMQTILRRARERGEITGNDLPPRIVSLPFDLFRHEALMTLTAVPHDTILEIVDDIFLPLLNTGAA